MTKAILALEDGTVLHGISVGYQGIVVGEVVFNTAMTGYQEILTDLSYTQQIVILTHPHIGNVGVNLDDVESNKVAAAGLIVRDLSPYTSNWRATSSLNDYLEKSHTVAIAEIDTRHLTRIIREKGALRGCIMAGDNATIEQALEHARQAPSLVGLDLAKQVSIEKAYDWPEPSKKQYKVVAYDYGVKHNILHLLKDRGCSIHVVPAQTPAETVLNMKPDGIFLSNGPGDPRACTYAIDAIKSFIKTEIPLFGICLGHQLLALAFDATIEKMKFGHHGANHPVQDLQSGKVWITSQNHGFAVTEASLPAELTSTHRSLFDGSLQGIAHIQQPILGFQGHPEASPGPHDAALLFDRFIEFMKHYKRNQTPCQKEQTSTVS